MKTRKEIKALAREALRGQRESSVLLGFMYLLLVSILGVGAPLILALVLRSFGRIRFPSGLLGVGLGIGWLIHLLVMALIMVLAVNLYGEYRKIYSGERSRVDALFTGVGQNFFRKLGGILWMVLWIMLWSFLFLIPGIIKALSYFATPFILAEYPNVKAREALRLSKRMTKGYKGQLFLMMLSFIGWGLLSGLTLGILGIVFVFPYLYLTYAGFYTELRDTAIEKGIIDPDELEGEAVFAEMTMEMGEDIPADVLVEDIVDEMPQGVTVEEVTIEEIPDEDDLTDG